MIVFADDDWISCHSSQSCVRLFASKHQMFAFFLLFCSFMAFSTSRVEYWNHSFSLLFHYLIVIYVLYVQRNCISNNILVDQIWDSDSLRSVIQGSHHSHHSLHWRYSVVLIDNILWKSGDKTTQHFGWFSDTMLKNTVVEYRVTQIGVSSDQNSDK